MATLAAMARLQAHIHAVTVPVGLLPGAHAVLQARCDDAAATAPTDALARLGSGDRLLHGDLNLGNVVTAEGRTLAVDWAQVMTGDPAADVAWHLRSAGRRDRCLAPANGRGVDARG